MKQVTAENVKARIAELEWVDQILGLGLHAEFELACLRKLAASLETKPVAYSLIFRNTEGKLNDYVNVNTTFATLEEAQTYGKGGRYVTQGDGSIKWVADQSLDPVVVPLYTAPPVQVNSVDDDVSSVVSLLESNEWAEHCTKTELGQRLESEITRLVGYVQPAPVASDAEPSLSAMMRALDAFYADDDVPERAMLAAFRILLADVRNQGHQEPAADNSATADELRAQGVDIMKAKTLQSMQRSRSSFDAETWAVAEQCLLGLVDGCEVVANELRTGKLPERFRPQPDDTAPQQFEALATSGKSEHLLNAERIAREAKALSDRLNDTSAGSGKP